jgi:hypothetical protein
MIGLNHYRTVSLCLLATIFLVACTRRQQFWASPTVREIEEVKSRTVPSNGSLLRESGPIRDTSSIRASWEIQTGSDNQVYFQWLKNQLGREYHVTSETASAMTLVKQIEGDSYTIAIQGSATPTGTVVEAQFVAAPDYWKYCEEILQLGRKHGTCPGRTNQSTEWPVVLLEGQGSVSRRGAIRSGPGADVHGCVFRGAPASMP